MVSAVGSSPTPSAVSTTVASTAAIEAQIARYKQELSNCVNCETAKTMQGKANIQALTSKISILESRLEKVTTSNPDDQPAALSPTTASDSGTNSNAVALISESKTSDESATTLNSSDSNTGRFVDVFV